MLLFMSWTPSVPIWYHLHDENTYIPVEFLLNAILSLYSYQDNLRTYVIDKTLWFELEIVATENKVAIKIVLTYHFEAWCTNFSSPVFYLRYVLQFLPDQSKLGPNLKKDYHRRVWHQIIWNIEKSLAFIRWIPKVNLVGPYGYARC